MRAEFGAIGRLLQSGKLTAQRNKTWTAIHDQTGLGAVQGNQYHFTRGELQKLREYARQRTGLDPQFDTTKGGRMEAADNSNNEKFTNDSVFGHLLVLATAGDAEVFVGGQSASTPPGALLSVLPEALDRQSLKSQRVVLVENGAPMTEWDKIQLPPPWDNSVILYRGHRENAGFVQQIVADQPSSNLALYYDFDPEGLEMALRTGKGTIFVPEDWRTSLIDRAKREDVNQRDTFRKQFAALDRAKQLADGTPFTEILATMEQGELAIMQEHLTRRAWRLTGVNV